MANYASSIPRALIFAESACYRKNSPFFLLAFESASFHNGLYFFSLRKEQSPRCLLRGNYLNALPDERANKRLGILNFYRVRISGDFFLSMKYDRFYGPGKIKKKAFCTLKDPSGGNEKYLFPLLSPSHDDKSPIKCRFLPFVIEGQLVSLMRRKEGGGLGEALTW